MEMRCYWQNYCNLHDKSALILVIFLIKVSFLLSSYSLVLRYVFLCINVYNTIHIAI